MPRQTENAAEPEVLSIPITAGQEAPHPSVIEAITEHFADDHDGAQFDLRSDLLYEGNSPKQAKAIYIGQTPGSVRGFRCLLCSEHGQLFRIGTPDYSDPQLQAHRFRFSGFLRELGAELSNEERAALLEAQDRGELSKAVLSATRSHKRLRTAHKHSPAYTRRLQGAQRYLLERYKELGTVAAAIEDLASLYDRDRERWTEVMGTSDQIKEGTIEQYWSAIPPQTRERATTAMAKRRKPTG